MSKKKHAEKHRSNRTGWLRAAVLGANDGIVSVAGLMVGVAASGADKTHLLITGVAGLVSGGMSMAAGEYVSVSSQADTEKADLKLEKHELAKDPHNELLELAGIYEKRGLEPALARKVAEQLTEHNALAAHARDELGITETLRAKPLQAVLTSAIAFSSGAILPLAAALLAPSNVTLAISCATLLALAISGAVAARVGGAPILKGSARVMFWGALAIVISYGVGRLFDVSL